MNFPYMRSRQPPEVGIISYLETVLLIYSTRLVSTIFLPPLLEDLVRHNQYR